MTDAANTIIIVCWVTFLCYWFVSARRVKATAQRQSLSSMLAHRVPVGIGWWLMACPKFPSPLNRSITPHNLMTFVSGAILCVLGLYVTIWARRTLAGNWSSDVTFKQSHELIKSGPYRFVRHPIYTGLLLMCLATAIEFGEMRFWLALPVWFIGFWLKLRQEERLMLRHFPEQYALYLQQTNALVPFVL
ncbi:MAG TPA: isoprenylcysteine carboxylmethyltransferase family protein [Verrucomicrobiae bacterium]|nr:isoprenylcysteine carboxylmethyltransferase family protein [Verrucomicrobiae bacterium]